MISIHILQKHISRYSNLPGLHYRRLHTSAGSTAPLAFESYQETLCKSHVLRRPGGDTSSRDGRAAFAHGGSRCSSWRACHLRIQCCQIPFMPCAIRPVDYHRIRDREERREFGTVPVRSPTTGSALRGSRELHSSSCDPVGLMLSYIRIRRTRLF